MFCLYILLLIVLVTFYVVFKKRNNYWKDRGVPYPKPALIFGNTGKAIIRTNTIAKICNDIYKQYEDYAYVGMFNLWKPAIVVRDPELIKDVLIKEFNSFRNNWFQVEHEVDPVLSKNPFVMLGDEWKTVRTQLTPQYTSAKIKTMIPLMQEVTKNLVVYIKEQSKIKNTNCFEAIELSSRYTGDNYFTCAYGLEGKSFAEETPLAFKIGSPVPKIFRDIVLNAIKHREENNIVRKDYLSFLIDLKKSRSSPYEVTDDYLIAHSFTFFLEAFETSSISMAFTLYELALNPDVQDKARTEINKVLKQCNGILSHEAIQELEYVENIVSESLRKHPLILFMCRICTEDYIFPPPKGEGMGEDVVIKKGTQVFIPIDAIHADPHIYPNPDRFDPDRFKEEVKNTRPKCSYLGFGEGPRICLGRNYGLMQIKVALVAILSEFELRINQKTKVPYERAMLQVINYPKGGIFIDFHPRC